MTEPLVPFGRSPAAGGPPPGEPEPMERLVENIVRLIDRLHPPGSADIPAGLSGATAQARLAGELAAVRAHAADLEQRLATAEADLAEREADADGIAALHTRLSDSERH